jgi:hypothetical protein
VTWDSSVLSDTLRSQAYLGRIAYTPDLVKVSGKQKPKVWHKGLLTGMLRRCGHAVTRSPKEQGTNLLRRRNLKKKSSGAACQMPCVNSRLVDSVVRRPAQDTRPLWG